MSEIKQSGPSEVRKSVERMSFRVGMLLVTSIALVLVWPIAWQYFSPLILAVPIAAMLQPLMRFLKNKLHLRQSTSAIIAVVLLLVLCVGLATWLTFFGVQRLTGLLTDSPKILSDITTNVQTMFDALTTRLTLDEARVVQVRALFDQGLSLAGSEATGLLRQAVTILTGFITQVPAFLVYVCFLFITIYYVNKGYDRIRDRLPGGKNADPNSSATELTHKAVGGFVGYFRLQFIYSLITFVFSTVALSLFHYDYPWLIALLAAFFDFLPLFGPGTVYIPWMLASLILGDFTTFLRILIIYLAFLAFRRVTEPRFMSDNIGISPLLSVVGMYAGMKVGGLIGLIGGPVVMCVLSAFFKGRYLNGTRKDIQTIVTYLFERWNWRVPTLRLGPLPDAEEDEEPGPIRRLTTAIKGWMKGKK